MGALGRAACAAAIGALVLVAVEAGSADRAGAGEGGHAAHGVPRPSSAAAGHAASAPAPDGARAARFEVPEPGSYALPPIDRIEPHSLLGISGRPEALLALGPGEVALVSFVYLQCNEACPLSTALLHQLDRTLAEDPQLAGRVELVTVSFDPARDTPEALAELRARLAPRGRWRFLTARDEAALRPVLADFGQDAVWVPGERNAPDALRHVLKVFLVDADHTIRQIYSTGFLDERLVLADLRTLSLPSAAGPRPQPGPPAGP
ncbi:MAG: SCO family protein [Myxococcota bacterium]